MNKEEFIYEYYHNAIADGDSLRGCCGKGCYRSEISGESPSSCDLNIRRKGDTLLYNCFSGSCGLNGGGAVHTGDRPSLHQRVSTLPAKRSISSSANFVRFIPSDGLRYLEENNISHATAVAARVMWDTTRGRLVFPVQTNGKDMGFITRSLDSGIKWWKDLKDGDCIYTHSSSSDGISSDVGYLVEAVTSCLALEQMGLKTCAILGSYMSENKIKHIKQWVKSNNITELVLLLDPDVSRDKKYYLARLLTKSVCKCRVVHIKQKPRYLSLRDIAGDLKKDQLV